jgi:Fe-S oxidoreductase/nitrate reductase gamma subunit
MTPQVPVFAAVFVLAVAFFIYSCYQRFSLVALGKADNRFNELGNRFMNMLYYAFGQRRVVKKKYPFGLNHFVFFWCFIILMIANTEFLFHGLFPSVIALSLLPAPLYFTLALIFDIVSILALLAVLLAISRRLFFPPKYIEARKADAFVILGLVAILMLAFFSLHGSEIAMGEEKAAAFMPVSSFVGKVLFAGVAKAALPGMIVTFWWIHALVLLGFLNYLPYSKHMHILTSIPNCFFKSIEKVNTQKPEKFAKENTYGAGVVSEFGWKDLFDSYSCTECGRCNDNCPATNTGKELNPRLVVHDIKINLLNNGKLLKKGECAKQALIGSGQEGSVSEASIWACTTCGACMEVCPVFIEHVPKIVEMRRHLVQMDAKFPDELLALFENMENRSNPWGIIPAEKGKWTAEVTAPAFEKGKTEYLLYVGCSGSLDTRNKRNTESIARILNKAGVSWGTLGKDEKCCGESVRRLGNEYLFDHMAKDFIKQLNDLGVKKIITECPHCFSALKNDYKQFGADFEVVHHSQFILDLIESGKIKLNKKADVGNLVFHDSCYLGRYNSIFDQPRKLIELSTGKLANEMGRNRETSFCCGAGGGRMWMEEKEGSRINHERINEAMKSNPDAICVCCPYCVTMMEDGLTDLKASEKVHVYEISELIEKAIE